MWSAGDAIADSGDRAVLGYVKLRARPRRWTRGGKGVHIASDHHHH